MQPGLGILLIGAGIHFVLPGLAALYFAWEEYVRSGEEPTARHLLLLSLGVAIFAALLSVVFIDYLFINRHVFVGVYHFTLALVSIAIFPVFPTALVVSRFRRVPQRPVSEEFR